MLRGAKPKGGATSSSGGPRVEPRRILTKCPIDSGSSRSMRCRRNRAGGGKDDDMSRRSPIRRRAVAFPFQCDHRSLGARRSLARRLCSNLTALALLIALVASGAWAQPALTPLSTTEVGPGAYVHSGGGRMAGREIGAVGTDGSIKSSAPPPRLAPGETPPERLWRFPSSGIRRRPGRLPGASRRWFPRRRTCRRGSATRRRRSSRNISCQRLLGFAIGLHAGENIVRAQTLGNH